MDSQVTMLLAFSSAGGRGKVIVEPASCFSQQHGGKWWNTQLLPKATHTVSCLFSKTYILTTILGRSLRTYASWVRLGSTQGDTSYLRLRVLTAHSNMTQ